MNYYKISNIGCCIFFAYLFYFYLIFRWLNINNHWLTGGFYCENPTALLYLQCLKDGLWLHRNNFSFTAQLIVSEYGITYFCNPGDSPWDEKNRFDSIHQHSMIHQDIFYSLYIHAFWTWMQSRSLGSDTQPTVPTWPTLVVLWDK